MEGKKSWTELIVPKDIEKAKKYLELRRADPRAVPAKFETRFVNKEGKSRDVLITLALIPGTTSAVVSLLGITRQKKTEATLIESERDLEAKSRMLEEANTALRVLLKQREADKIELEENIFSNVTNLVMPYVEKLKNASKSHDQSTHLELLESNLKNITSPFLRNMTLKYINLTPREIQIDNFIKEGKTTKEISETLKVSTRAIEFHRVNIRVKLQLKNKKANLRTYLLTQS